MKKNVAFLSFGISDIRGGGGAERFFADFYDYYSAFLDRNYNLRWLIDVDSSNNLHKVNKLKTADNITALKLFSNRYKSLLENLQVLFFIIRFRIKVVHIPLYNRCYLPFIDFIQNLPRIIRPKISINIVDCSLPHCYSNVELPRHVNVRESYEPLFKLPVDGYFAWNSAFVDFYQNNNFGQHNPILYAIKSRFCDTKNFLPEEPKQQTIVFASRLTVFKNADWFLEAILYLKANHPSVIKDWCFIICGDGPLRADLMEYARINQMGELVKFLIEPNLWKVFNYSKCFVSCQDFDNFPSLSMAEAMASGNAIISRNVGQTSLFVEQGKNGFLAESDNPEGIALAMKRFLDSSADFESYSRNSIRLMEEVHTPSNFTRQIEFYWSMILKGNQVNV